MNADELKNVLDQHAKWLRDQTGKQADLSSADLSSADLSSADLSSADLRYANLSSADLSSADLSSADLRYANLRSADLRYANLRSADLRYANLRYADLSYANLSYADLRSADLRYADLRSADLRYADLSIHIYSITGSGSARRMTTYVVEWDKIFCGCFTGTLSEFSELAEKTHAKNPQWFAEYRATIAFFRAMHEVGK